MLYETRILNALLNSYENSLLSRGENKVAVHISYAFTKKNMPAYFDESSLSYEEIHGAAEHLEELGFIKIIWKGNRKNHIIQKVLLCEEKKAEIYAYLHRTPKKRQEEKQLAVLQELKETCHTPIASCFIFWLSERICAGKTVKEYLNLEEPEETRKLIRAISFMEENQEEIYIREFSIRCFGDSKILEKRWSLLGKIFRRFSDDYEDMDTDAIFAEHGIYHTPNYVYIKGNGCIQIGSKHSMIDLRGLKQGIGLSGEDLYTLQWIKQVPVKQVITIENLTTFFRWEEENSILIYLGGYHNEVRRNLLKKMYETFPDARYLHFGDIDVGGFEIYQDLCRRTGIPFEPWLMGMEQLKKYQSYTKKLTENDQKRLEGLLEKEEYRKVWPVLCYMAEHGEKLEQESIISSEKTPTSISGE